MRSATTSFNAVASRRRWAELTRAHLKFDHVAVLSQDPAVLSDTVRENLFALGALDTDCWLALAVVELEDRVEIAGGLDAWINQDMLSLGEGQRLNMPARCSPTARSCFSMSLSSIWRPTRHRGF